MVKVFVYGTLKKGRGNHILLLDSLQLQQDTVQGYTLYGSGIPFAMKSEGDYVKGEVYEVDEDTLKRLDALEGHPDWYERKLVETDSGHQAWMYIMEDEYYKSNHIGNEF